MFRNTAVPPHSRTAENVTVRIEVLDQDGKSTNGWIAQWLADEARTEDGYLNDPNDMGPLYPSTSKVDIAPGWVPSRLPIALRRHGQIDCYLWSSWKYAFQPETFKLGRGTHGVRVRLLGTNFTCDYDFRVVNEPADFRVERIGEPGSFPRPSPVSPVPPTLTMREAEDRAALAETIRERDEEQKGDGWTA